jgi:hypothetical protein
MVGLGTHSELAERIARGDYVVDAEAVAEAMLRRWRTESSLVFVAAEALDPTAVRSEEDEPSSGADAA